MLARELYSPHLDTHQRLLILESLSAAATRLAGSAHLAAGSNDEPQPMLSSSNEQAISGKPQQTRRWGSGAAAKAAEPRRMHRNM